MADPNWANQTIWTGDCLNVMRGMNSESVDLIYLDPPFNSNTNYAAPIGSKAAGAAFKDTWTLDDVDRLWLLLLRDANRTLYHVIEATRLVQGNNTAAYLSMMAQRLVEMRRVLKPTGSIYLHCDPTASHYLKAVMDAVFGPGFFRNEIVWHYRKWATGNTYFRRIMTRCCSTGTRKIERSTSSTWSVQHQRSSGLGRGRSCQALMNLDDGFHPSPKASHMACGKTTFGISDESHRLSKSTLQRSPSRYWSESYWPAPTLATWFWTRSVGAQRHA